MFKHTALVVVSALIAGVMTVPGMAQEKLAKGEAKAKPHRPGNARAVWPAPTAPGQRGGQGDPWSLNAGVGASLAKTGKQDID